MAGMVNDIISNFPRSEENRLLIFDHFINDATGQSSGTWPVELITLIDKTKNGKFPEFMKSRIGSQLSDISNEEKQSMILGRALKSRAAEVRSWINEYYNRGYVQEANLPSGYTMLQFLEAMRQVMIPIAIHKKALKNSKRRVSTDRAEWAIRCELLYNKTMKTIKKFSFLPPGWLPFILLGLPRGNVMASIHFLFFVFDILLSFIF